MKKSGTYFFINTKHTFVTKARNSH